jgi:hypothetical protein
MPKLLFIILLLLGLNFQENVARAQQVQPYKPMTESEWNEAKKGFSDSVLLEINKLNQEPNHIFGENAFVGDVSWFRANSDSLFDFHAFRKHASENELLVLTSHPNPMVRCYAYLAISHLPSLDFIPILEHHFNDTAKVKTTPEFINDFDGIYFWMNDKFEISVGDIMVFIATSTRYFTCYECKKLNTFDRYILYQKLIHTNNKLNNTYIAWKELHPSAKQLSISSTKNRFTTDLSIRAFEGMLNLWCFALDNLPDSSFNLLRYHLSQLSDSSIFYLSNQNIIETCLGNNFRLDDSLSIQKTKQLAQALPIQELELLTNFPIPTLRCMAFSALATDINYNLLPILANHINDEEETSVLSESIKVNEALVWIATETRSQYFPYSYPRIYNVIDSIIIMFSHHSNSLTSNCAYVLPQKPYFEVKLRELAQNGESYHIDNTVVALAKYQNLADTSFIITHRKNIKKGELDFELNLDAIEKFRHPYFLPYIKKYFYKGNIEVAYIYPLQEFLPTIKVNLQKQLKLNDKNAIAGILEILLGYATTPHKNQAKDIVSLVYQYHSSNKSNFTNISLFKDWGVSHLKHLTYFINIKFNFNFMRHSEEKDSMFIDFYNKEEFETILWKTWENYHIVTYQEYTYLKNIDNERSLKLGYLTLVKVLTDTGYTYYENPNNYFDTYTYRSPLLPIAYDVINKYSYKQAELLPSIKHKLLNNLSKGRNIYFPLNFLIVYTCTPHHEDAKKIATLSFSNELPNQQKFIGGIHFLRWCPLITSNNTNLHLPYEETFAYKSDYKSLDTLFLNFYSREEVEGIVWKIWETDHMITQYLFEYLTNKNKSKAHVFAKNSITSIINDRKGIFLDRMHIEDHNMKQDYRHVIEDCLRVMYRNYPDTLFELLNKDLEKPSLALHALNKFIGFLPSNTETEWSKKFNYLDKLIVRLQQEADFKTAAVLVYTLFNRTVNLEPIRQRIIKAYTNNEHFKNNKKAQQEFNKIKNAGCCDFRAWYHKLILDY